MLRPSTNGWVRRSAAAAMMSSCAGPSSSPVLSPWPRKSIASTTRPAALLRTHPLVDGRSICYRGSSMGGYYGLQAANDAGLAAAVLVCPASEQVLLAGIARADDPDEVRSLSDRGLD